MDIIHFIHFIHSIHFMSRPSPGALHGTSSFSSQDQTFQIFPVFVQLSLWQSLMASCHFPFLGFQPAKATLFSWDDRLDTTVNRAVIKNPYWWIIRGLILPKSTQCFEEYHNPIIHCGTSYWPTAQLSLEFDDLCFGVWSVSHIIERPWPHNRSTYLDLGMFVILFSHLSPLSWLAAAKVSWAMATGQRSWL